MGVLATIKNFYALYKWRINIAIITTVILGVIGALKWYGVSEYQRGIAACTESQKTAVINTLQTNSQIWKETLYETSKITDFDAAGAALGILRPDAAR